MKFQPILKYQKDEKVLKIVLKAIRENVYSKKFEGEIRYGKINGYYSSFTIQTLLNGYVMSTLKIVGEYDLVKGSANIHLKLSSIFYIILTVPLFLLSYFFWVLLIAESTKIPLAVIFFGFSLSFIVTILIHLIEVKSFQSDMTFFFKQAELY